MELEAKQCANCDSSTIITDHNLTACPDCEAELKPAFRCAWCNKWSDDNEYCSHCGAIVVSAEQFPAVRFLKQKGVEKWDLAIDLEQLSESDLNDYKSRFEEQYQCYAPVLQAVAFCQSFLSDKTYTWHCEQKFIDQFPLSDDVLKKISVPAKGESSDADYLHALCGAEGMDLLQELAALAAIHVAGSVAGKPEAQQWLQRVTTIALGDSERVTEALVALAHWRTSMTPYSVKQFDGESGRKLYNIANAKFHNSTGDASIWLAVLLARTEYYHKLEKGQQTKRGCLELLNQGLQSENRDLKVSCILALNDESGLAQLLEGGGEELRDLALARLVAMQSPHIEKIIEQGDPASIRLIAQHALSSSHGVMSPRLLESLLQQADQLEQDFINQVIQFAGSNPKNTSEIYPLLCDYALRSENRELALQVAPHIVGEDAARLQTMIVSQSVTEKDWQTISEIGKHQPLEPALAETVVRAVSQAIKDSDSQVSLQVFADLFQTQMQSSFKSHFIFRRYIIEALFNKNLDLSNRMYELVRSSPAESLLTEADDEATVTEFRQEFCETYFGSVENFISQLEWLLKKSDQYQAFDWVLRCLLQSHSLRPAIATGDNSTLLLLHTFINIYSEQRDLRQAIAEFVCAPMQDQPSAFLDLVTEELLDTQFMDLLARGAQNCVLPKKLIVEMLQLTDIVSDSDHIDYTTTILNFQCQQSKGLAFFCYGYLIKSSLNAANAQSADLAFDLLQRMMQQDIPYLSFKDKMTYKISDFPGLIKNHFESFSAFAAVLKEVMSGEQVLNAELWMLQQLGNNAKTVMARNKSNVVELRMLIFKLAQACARGKYDMKQAVGPVACVLAFVPAFQCHRQTVTNLTSKINMAVRDQAVTDICFSQIRMFVNDVSAQIENDTQKASSRSIDMSQNGIRDELLAMLDTMSNDTSDGLSQSFEVSKNWIIGFNNEVTKGNMRGLISIISLLHSHAEEFKELLTEEKNLLMKTIDSLVTVLFYVDTSHDDQLLSQKLIAAEVLKSLSQNASMAKYCISKLQSNCATQPRQSIARRYADGIIEILSENYDIHASSEDDPILILDNDDSATVTLLNDTELETLLDEVSRIRNSFEDSAIRQALEKAAELLEIGNYISAVNQIKNAAEIDESDELYYLIGKIYLLYHLTEQSSKYIQKSLVRNPQNADALSLYAWYQVEFEKNYTFALDLARRAYQIAPDNVNLLIQLSDIELRMGNFAAATREIQKALKCAPKEPRLYSQLGEIFKATKRYEEACNYYAKALKLGDRRYDVYYGLGYCFQKRGIHDKALGSFNQAVRSDTNNASAYYAAGNIYMKANELVKAERCFMHAIQKESTNTLYRKKLAQLLQMQGKSDKAINVLETQVNQESVDSELLLLLARLYTSENRIFEAQGCLEKAILIAPEESQLYYVLSTLYEKSESWGNAVGILQRALDLEPGFSQARVKMGSIYLQLDRLDKALACYKTVLEHEPHNIDALNGIGDIYSAQGDHNKAQNFYKKAIQIQPDSGASYINLGNSYFNQEKFIDAARSYQKGANLEPEIEGLEDCLQNVMPHVKDATLLGDLKSLLNQLPRS